MPLLPYAGQRPGPIERPELLLRHVREFITASKAKHCPWRKAPVTPYDRGIDRDGEISMTGQSVLVTGTITGLGKEMAIHLASRGFKVYATIRDLSGADSLLAEGRARGVDFKVMALDVTDKASVTRGVDTIVSECGGIYGLINNAGIGLRGYFEDLDDADIRQMYDANVFGVMEVTRAVLPHMRKAKRGRILMISSVGGRIGSLGVSTYCSPSSPWKGSANLFTWNSRRSV